MTVLLLLTLLWNTAGGSFLPTITRLSLHSCNEVRLVCQVQTVQGFSARVENARFLANDTNIQDLLTGTEFDDSVEGEISFTLRQELEAFYKCENDSFTSTHSIPLTSCPTRTEVDRYHAVPEGQEVSLECGVRQGKLGSYYHPKWRKGIPTVDTTSPDSLYRMQREELKDFALTFLNPSLSDSGMYLCEVETELENGQSFFVEEGNQVELLVYERPVITYMTDDTTAIINNGGSKNVTSICNATGSPDLMVLWYHNGERVASKEKYLTHETTTEGSVSSMLTMSGPRLTDSGTMTCQAKVSFKSDAGNDNRSTETLSTETMRNIIILDTNFSIKVIVTQDSDLLVRISLEDIILQQPVKLYLKFTSKETGEIISDRPDSKYSGVSVIYHFVPASHIPDGYRRFWLQVALVVDDKVGPYNPPVLTSSLVTDLDEQTEGGNGVWSSTVIIYIVVAVAAACVLAVCIIAIACSVTCICINRQKKKKDQHCEVTRQETSVEKLRIIQESTRHLSSLLPKANGEQAGYINEILKSLQENTGHLVKDSAKEGGVVAGDSGEEGGAVIDDDTQEVDVQGALKHHIEILKELELSEQFTHKLEEIESKLHSTTCTVDVTGGEHGNG